VTEWYVNGPVGLQQGFTVTVPPLSRQNEAESLHLEVALTGGWKAEVEAGGRDLTLIGPDQIALRYTGLTAWDATGRELPARLTTSDLRPEPERLLIETSPLSHPSVKPKSILVNIEIDDRGAIYPLTIDPLVEQAKLTASDGMMYDRFGSSVAINGDTIVVGAYGVNSYQGWAYVFVKPSGGWSGALTQTAKLTASDGATSDFFGQSVAVSGDTAVVGALGDDIGANTDQGSAYVFVKPSGGWSGTLTQTAKLTASDGAMNNIFGYSVAISGDTVVVGGYAANNSQGSAYAFVKPSGGWSGALTQTAKLAASDAMIEDFFGGSVAISGDTVVVGASGDDVANTNQGSAYVFVKPGGGWGGTLTQTAKLTASDGATGDFFGQSVAVSGDTVVIGAYYANSYQGSAYVFVKPGGGWSGALTQTAKLIASDGVGYDFFGDPVAVSGDTVVVGAIGNRNPTSRGSAYVFVKPGEGWSGVLTQTTKLIASDGAIDDGEFFGYKVAISGDTVVVGAQDDSVGANTAQGSAYIFVLSPDIAVLGNGLVINDGNNIPSAADHTDFGSVALGQAFTRTFTIYNSGAADLNLTGSPAVSITGAAASDFTVVSQPTTPVISNTTTTFQVRFDPTVAGTRAATITIANDDGDENPYDFAIQGMGSNTAPIANAGTDQYVSTGALVTLDGSLSSDLDGHLPLIYGWTQTGGSAVTLNSVAVVSPTFTVPDSATALTFTLTVTDSFGLAAPIPDEVVVTVANYDFYLPLILK
jgi:hypothetical protein